MLGLSFIIALLMRLTPTSVAFHWSDVFEMSFQKLKTLLTLDLVVANNLSNKSSSMEGLFELRGDHWLGWSKVGKQPFLIVNFKEWWWSCLCGGTFFLG